MDTADESKNEQSMPLNRNRIARAIFIAAESIGMPDRQLIERLTAQVIERLEQLEQPQTLPGMEDLVPKSRRRQKPLPTDAEIEAMVKEILEEPVRGEETETKMEITTTTKPEVQPTSGISLSENARHVLERRYLKK
ncbi:hypothetical protein ACFLWG_03925, partial [Chloroflexota bacterium]